MSAAQESRPEEPTPRDYLAALNRFWEMADTATQTQLRLARTAAQYAGNLAVPKEDIVIPQVSENLVAARDYLQWLADQLGLAVFVTVEQQDMLVRGFSFDNTAGQYSAIAGPAHLPRAPQMLIPLAASHQFSIDAMPRSLMPAAPLGRAA